MKKSQSFKTVIHRLMNKMGFGTLEVVIIIAVLLSVALIFRSVLISYAQRLITSVFNEETVIEVLSSEQS